MEASLISKALILSTFFGVPFLVFGTFKFSGFSLIKSLMISLAVASWGCFMYWFAISGQNLITQNLRPLIVLLHLILFTSVNIFLCKKFIDQPLAMDFTTGIQLFRIIGAAFIIEYLRGNSVSAIFAYTAGIGDILVALVAALIFAYKFLKGKMPAKKYFLFLIFIGVADFVSAFFFGIASSEGPMQLFSFQNPNQVLAIYPLNLIPLFLVPLALTYHWLMWHSIQLKKHAD